MMKSRVIQEIPSYMGDLVHKKLSSSQDHDRALGIVLLWGPRGVLFLMSEGPLQSAVVQGTVAFVWNLASLS